jgi:hypothetical protein
MKYDRVKKKSAQLLSLTGFTVEEFEAFLPMFKNKREEYHSHYTLRGKVRERISCGRRAGLLPLIGDKLLFILSCLKNSLLQEYRGVACGMTQPQCNRWIHLLSDVPVKTLDALHELPGRNAQRMQQTLRGYKDVMLDGTERPIQRPQASGRQKSCYSGKKRMA